MKCFYCKRTGARICSGHCGLCEEFDDGKISSRDFKEGYDKGADAKLAQKRNMEA